MKIYDISQEVFGCQVFPGDPMPEKTTLNSIGKGDLYNLTSFAMCAHNGTHIDAPFHFIKDGKTVDEICLEAVVGMAYVAEHNGIVTGNDAAGIIERAQKRNPEAGKRILLKGDVEVSLEAAKVFAASDLLLLGNESQTVGPENAPMAVHLALLEANVILLEGIRLSEGGGIVKLEAVHAPADGLGIYKGRHAPVKDKGLLAAGAVKDGAGAVHTHRRADIFKRIGAIAADAHVGSQCRAAQGTFAREQPIYGGVLKIVE